MNSSVSAYAASNQLWEEGLAHVLEVSKYCDNWRWERCSIQQTLNRHVTQEYENIINLLQSQILKSVTFWEKLVRFGAKSWMNRFVPH